MTVAMTARGGFQPRYAESEAAMLLTASAQQLALFRAEAARGHDHGDRRDDVAELVADRGADGADADVEALLVEGQVLARDLVELLAPEPAGR